MVLFLEKWMWHLSCFIKDQKVIGNNYFLVNKPGKVKKNISEGFAMCTLKIKHFMLCFNNLSLLDRALKRVQCISTNHQFALL